MYQQQYMTVQEYQAQSFAAVIEVAVSLAILVSVGLFVFSQIRGAMKGEEVRPPLEVWRGIKD